MNTPKYRPWSKQRGRSGSVFYAEDSQLVFDMEMMANYGTVIYVPTPEKWNIYFREHQAVWAIGRRAEILDRIGQTILRKQYGRGKYSVENHWIDLFLAPSRTTRILDYLTNYVVKDY